MRRLILHARRTRWAKLALRHHPYRTLLINGGQFRLPRTRAIRRWRIFGAAASVLLSVLLVATVADAHHILGLPHYSYQENYPQVPTLEYPATAGPYDVLMTSYPGRPVPGEAATICFYIKDRQTTRPYETPVTVRVLRTATFGANTVVHPPATHRPFDNQHKYTVTFPADAEYIVELTMDVEGRPETIPFLVVVGQPTATTSIVVSILVGLAAFLVVVRAIKKKRQRRRSADRSEGTAAMSDPDQHAASATR